MKLEAYECDYCGDELVLRPEEKYSLSMKGWMTRYDSIEEVHICHECIKKGE
jgi:hypothetical protein